MPRTISLNNLPAIGPKQAKRRGQGIGSGKGSHTSGRGQKGQKARSKLGLLFEGTKTKKSLVKRLPLLRGKGKFGPKKNKPIAVNLKTLQGFSPNTEITGRLLVEKGIVRTPNVKILAVGEIKTPLVIKVPISKSAAEKIVKAGGAIQAQA